MGHLDDVGMTYFEHFSLSVGFGLILLEAGAKALVHAIYPEIFVTSTSDAVSKLRLLLLAHGR